MDKEKLHRIYQEATRTMVIRQEPRIVYGDTPTFMEFPKAYSREELAKANVVFMGFPHEGFRPYSPEEALPPEGGDAPSNSIYFRTGTDRAPESVRKWSLHHSVRHYGGRGYLTDYDLCLADTLNVLDYGDAECVRGQLAGNVERARQKVREIVASGAIPLIQGGDHSTPIAGILGIADCTDKRIGIIGFDSHFDLLGVDGQATSRWYYSAASEYVRALETPNVEPQNIALIGMRGIHNPQEWAAFARDLGIRYFTMREVDEKGIDWILDEALERVGDGTEHLYVTLDIDVVDCTACPGQRFPDTPGLTPREIIRSLRKIGAARVIGGFDVSELSPQYDPQGATQLLAARCFLEVLGGLAAQFKGRNIDRWYR